MNVLEIKNLCKNYGSFSLENINLTLPAGTIMGLIGENGAGKSTTIKLILNMIHADSGAITILGKDNKTDITDLKEDIGVVLDEVGFNQCLTAKNVEKIMRYTYKNWNTDTFNMYLKKLEIPDDKKFKDFSKGMKMKLGIAVALSHDPKLLILDEATSGLDPVVRDDFMDVLMDFTRDETHSVLISSHIVSDLEKVCDYVAFLHKGKLVLSEEKDALKEKYGVIHVTPDTLESIPNKAIIGKRVSPYNIEAMVERAFVPAGTVVYPADIEQLFVFMVKGEE